MVPRVASHRNANSATCARKAAQSKKFLPGPPEQPIFVPETCPGRDEPKHLDRRKKPCSELFTLRLCNQRDRIFECSCLQKRYCNHQIAKPPQFNHQQLRFGRSGQRYGFKPLRRGRILFPSCQYKLRFKWVLSRIHHSTSASLTRGREIQP